MIDIYQIVSAGGVIFAMGMSVLSIMRSGKKEQNDKLDKLDEKLSEHILSDREDITQLQTQFVELDKKIERILGRLDK